MIAMVDIRKGIQPCNNFVHLKHLENYCEASVGMMYVIVYAIAYVYN